MTDKQIIIDGVDVSGCKHFENADQEMCCELTCCGGCRGIDCYYKQLKRKEQRIVKLNKTIEAKEQECEELKKQYNCYACGTCNGKEDYRNLERHHIGLRKSFDELHKQLDQLKEQNDELKKVNNHIENNRKQKADKLMRIEKLIIACSTGYTDEFIQELLVILHEPEPVSFENKYKTKMNKDG